MFTTARDKSGVILHTHTNWKHDYITVEILFVLFNVTK